MSGFEISKEGESTMDVNYEVISPGNLFVALSEKDSIKLQSAFNVLFEVFLNTAEAKIRNDQVALIQKTEKLTNKMESNKGLFVKNIDEPNVFGNFSSDKEYLQSVDLLIASTYEAEHRDEVIKRDIIPKLTSYKKLLDIGVGNGEATKFLGNFFENITVIDNSLDALSNLNSDDFIQSKPLTKIHAPIIEAEIPDKNYDLIMMSHTLYYIPLELRSSLVDKLYNHLNDNGKLVFIFNEGMDRYKLTSHFKGVNYLFKDFTNYSQKQYNADIIEHEESIETKNINVMQHIAGVCLKDAGATASKEELSEYLRLNHYNDQDEFYRIHMTQKFIIIGKHDQIDEE
jgi:hypothetical protein